MKDVFYCGTCNGFTPLATEWDGVRCLRCGDDFQCQECGGEIDRRGVCQRPCGGWLGDLLTEAQEVS